MKYNKVRGILRARQGSQIPKFKEPAGPLTPNPYNLGSSIPNEAKTITNNPIGDQINALIEAGQDYINRKLPNVAPGLEKYWLERTAKGLSLGFREGYLTVGKDGKINDSRPYPTSTNWIPTLPQTSQNQYYNKLLDITLGKLLLSKYSSLVNADLLLDETLNPSWKDKLGAFGKKIGNFANENLELIIGGVDYASNKLFGGTENSSEYDTIMGGAKILRNNLKGPAKWWATAGIAAVEGLNKIGAREIDGHTMNTYLKSRAGNYKGLLALNNKVESDKTKQFGMFNAGGFNAAQNRADKLFNQINTFENIINTADDQVAMSRNDIIYLNYDNLINGTTTDPLTYRTLSAKQGGTLDTKINLVKSRKFNQVINVNTKLVEEFKLGGNLPEIIWESEETCEWLPILEEYGTWEPVITDEVEEFREGGKTKEELETPEIEETNQKNLIPEGALHKNKHHMEHTEGLTLKGIPVIDNEGQLLAEIECDELIMSLEVTKALEERYHKFYNEETKQSDKDLLAIEAGKILVEQILFNTDDRTSLISKCEKGGKLCL